MDRCACDIGPWALEGQTQELLDLTAVRVPRAWLYHFCMVRLKVKLHAQILRSCGIGNAQVAS